MYTIDKTKQFEPIFHLAMKEVFTNTGAPLLYIGSISPLERVYLDPTNQVYYIKYLAPWDNSIYTISYGEKEVTNTNTSALYPYLSEYNVSSDYTKILGISFTNTNQELFGVGYIGNLLYYSGKISNKELITPKYSTLTYQIQDTPFYSNQILLVVETNEKILWDSNMNTYLFIYIKPYTNKINYIIKSNYQIISNFEDIDSSLDQLVFIGYSPEDEYANLQYPETDMIDIFYINTNSSQIYRANIYKIPDNGYDCANYDPVTNPNITSNHLPIFPDYKYTYNERESNDTSYTNTNGQRFTRNTYSSVGGLWLLKKEN